MKRLLDEVVAWVRSRARAAWGVLAPQVERSVAAGASADVVRTRRELAPYPLGAPQPVVARHLADEAAR